MSFKSYLRQRGYAEITAHRMWQITNAFEKYLEQKGKIPEQMTHRDMMEYIKESRNVGQAQNYLVKKVTAIKKWFDYRYIEPNPCEFIHLRTRPDHLPSPLLAEHEIKEVYTSYPDFTDEMIRDKVMLGVFCFQGVRTGELRHLRLDEVYLDVGFIKVRGRKLGANRSLRIHPLQYELLKKYVEEYRDNILKDRASELFCVKKGVTEQPQDLRNYIFVLTGNAKECYTKFKNFKQLRASVICNWLKEDNIREVQYKAGHKTIASTERYKQANTEQLQEVLDQLHPIK